MEMSYLDRIISQYNADRSYNYQVGRDQISDARYTDETAYNRGIYSDETAYSRAQDAYNNALAVAQATGDFSGLSAYGEYGWTPAAISAAEKQYVLQNTKKSSSGSSKKETDDADDADLTSLFADAYADGDAWEYIQANYKKYDIDSLTGLKSQYDAWEKEQKDADQSSRYDSWVEKQLENLDYLYRTVSKAAFERHVADKLANGELTQEIYDIWKATFNG